MRVDVNAGSRFMAAFRRYPIALWIAFCILVLTIHLLTLEISPPVWQDELQIIDYGRYVLDQDATWGLTWNLPEDKPVFPLNYLGPVVQAAFFEWSGFSVAAPRTVAMLAAILASTVLMLFLVRAGSRPATAMVLSAVFLLDPLLCQSYRGGRVDAIVMLLALLSILLIADGARVEAPIRRLSHYLVAGALAALSFFVWPSAVLLYPLLAFVFWQRTVEPSDLSDPKRAAVVAAGAFLLGAALTAAITIAPIGATFLEAMHGLASAAESRADVPIGSIGIRRIETFVVTFLHRTPLLFLASVALLISMNIVSRDRTVIALSIAYFLASLMIIVLEPYAHRNVYLIPYMIVTIAVALERSRAAGRRNNLATNIVLGVLLVWGAGVSLVARPAVALTHAGVRDIAVVVEQVRALDLIESGEHVLIGAWEMYPVGRKLGWYSIGPDVRGLPSSATSAESECRTAAPMLTRVTHGIVLATKDSSAMESVLAGCGFSLSAEIKTEEGSPYGPYRVYTRTP